MSLNVYQHKGHHTHLIPEHTASCLWPPVGVIQHTTPPLHTHTHTHAHTHTETQSQLVQLLMRMRLSSSFHTHTYTHTHTHTHTHTEIDSSNSISTVRFSPFPRCIHLLLDTS